MIEPVPQRGPERAAWWDQLYDAIASDAAAQRAVLLTYSPDDPDHATAWFEDGYRARLHQLLDHAIDRKVWTEWTA